MPQPHPEQQPPDTPARGPRPAHLCAPWAQEATQSAHVPASPHPKHTPSAQTTHVHTPPGLLPVHPTPSPGTCSPVGLGATADRDSPTEEHSPAAGCPAGAGSPAAASGCPGSILRGGRAGGGSRQLEASGTREEGPSGSEVRTEGRGALTGRLGSARLRGDPAPPWCGRCGVPGQPCLPCRTSEADLLRGPPRSLQGTPALGRRDWRHCDTPRRPAGSCGQAFYLGHFHICGADPVLPPLTCLREAL